MLRLAAEIGDCEVLYPGVGHSTVISSSVLLHVALLGQGDEIDTTQHCLRSNFEVLEKLSRYWPSLELTVRRLSKFQEICTEGDASDAYRLDKWMVAFLLSYHRTLDDKSEALCDNAVQDL